MSGICYKRWKSQLAGYWESSLSLAEYCRQNNLNVKTASKWRRRLKPDVVRRSGNPASRVEALEIVAISPPLISKNSGIWLEVGNLHIVLQSDFDIPTLQRLLTALEDICCCLYPPLSRSIIAAPRSICTNPSTGFPVLFSDISKPIRPAATSSYSSTEPLKWSKSSIGTATVMPSGRSVWSKAVSIFRSPQTGKSPLTPVNFTPFCQASNRNDIINDFLCEKCCF